MKIIFFTIVSVTTVQILESFFKLLILERNPLRLSNSWSFELFFIFIYFDKHLFI